MHATFNLGRRVDGIDIRTPAAAHLDARRRIEDKEPGVVERGHVVGAVLQGGGTAGTLSGVEDVPAERGQP